MRLDELIESEKEELCSIYYRYRNAFDRKDYAVSDVARAELVDWGCVPPSYSKWHPAFESTEHYRLRVEARSVAEKG